MKIEQWAIDEPIPYDRNPRKISDEAVNQVANSLSEAGWQQPIVVNKDGVIIVGHTRLKAAQKLKMDRVPVLVADLTKEQEDRYRLRDNKSGEFSMWDIEMLGIDWEAPELEELGFDLGDMGIEMPAEEGLTDEDEVPEVPDVPTSKEGQIWKLGDHRLMCGDSTDAEAVGKLMDGEKADMVFTDPPYGDNHAGMTWKHKGKGWKSGGGVDGKSKIANDSDISYLSEVCCNALVFSKEKSPKLVFFKWSHYSEIEGLFSGFGNPSSCCVWDRDEVAAATFSFNPSHEFCFFWGNLAEKHNKSNVRNVWRCKKERGSKELHPTVKPIEIIIDAVDVACIKKGLVLDFFGGSGSTMIACEKIGRSANLMELDPKYCDVIIKRWEDFTGKKAELIND